MKLHGQSVIGAELSTGKGSTFHAVNPRTRAELEPAFHRANEAHVRQALELAESAFYTFRATSGEQRATFLEAMADQIMALGEELIQRAHLETGLPEARLTGERARTVGQLKLFAGVAREGSWVDARIDTAMPDRQPLPRPDLRRMLVPLGPVVVFGSSNFPLAFSVAGGDTASALATGNPVVVKAHSAHPGTSELVATAIQRAVKACGLSPGVFSMLHGSGKEIGPALVKHPGTRAVGFTGSRSAGRALFDAAAARPDPIPVFAEMSSLNPVFLLPGALKENAAGLAKNFLGSMTLGVGQFCTKPGLAIAVGGKELQEFQDQLCQQVQAAAPGVMLHEGICDAYQSGMARALQSKGVSVLARSSQKPDPQSTQGTPVVAGIEARQFCQNPDLLEEVFGPYALLVTAGSLQELEELARSLDGQLTATVHGTASELAGAGKLLRILERKAGRLVINGFPTGVEVCPSMTHGGPYPATTDARFTSVGTAALQRFVRPVTYQGFPPALLPAELRDENPLGIVRLVNGKLTTSP